MHDESVAPKGNVSIDMNMFMTYYLTMLKVNIHDIKAHLSEYLDTLAEGETIVICRRNVPVAEIRPIAQTGSASRPVGLLKGKFRLSPGFFEALPEDAMRAFEGEV